MSFDKEALFKLLPAFNRMRDQKIGNSLLPAGSPEGASIDGPLKALLGLISEQIAVLEENLDQLYDDQFIETCAEWVVPYIGELVGTRSLIDFPEAPFSQRAQVANTIGYRRRKGTASIIEELARDVTGWTANVVEYFQLLATTQYLNHLRPGNLSVSPLRNWEQLEYIHTPFDKLTRTADTRNISLKQGKYNIPNIGIFLWRIDDYSVTHAPAYKVDNLRYKFDALGKDVQLYNHSAPEKEITHLADSLNVPAPLNRLITHYYRDQYYGVDKSIFVFGVNDVSICNLSDATDGTGNWVNMPDGKVAVDPVLGRIAFPAALAPAEKVYVNYFYGSGYTIGGGEYTREADFLKGDFTTIKVPADQPTIQAALNELAAIGGIIEITNNEYYIETPVVQIAAGKKIEIRAAEKQRPVLVLDADMEIAGGENASLSINGLLVSGGCLRAPVTNGDGALNQLATLFLSHCTLVPGDTLPVGTVPAQMAQPRLIIEADGVNVMIERSVTGPIRSADTAKIQISDSIVDAGDRSEIAYSGINGPLSYGAELSTGNVTIIGNVFTRIMRLAVNTIFFAKQNEAYNNEFVVAAERLQEGCVRFSYVPIPSRVPRKFQCHPDSNDDAVLVTPIFNSLKYGDPDYCQLNNRSAEVITKGADNEAEIGVFRNLYQPQRVQNLQIRLNEYLRFGLEAGIFYAS
ncbi:hypothetical protein A8C56_04825 [Niabella ginsenosidivorans]|uniref:Uncharacterized protein n=1 Tax=Niabella ginsenosidivorans TaxID=1176587 RepID=A0A1A9HYE7_9BACT|nr:hypothetical protein [Niabella ginsenosidivorans]ANH80396.1 hypothetical protein A8C56_04825 [Niabella ginsenosidivorans]